ncbi:MAG: hypothetical protein DMD38_07495 [Gemmatimonadetes bacterium]|nr:MAG: hypothetical protein AUI09_01275 [Gemmatimonadetes bacterium 13_2_20CM_2_66_5]OLC85572.1 MAG: hypothetical protein AUI86_11945 [Gemmatimonadetes bacterium 13_1_40CM_3_66_12]PYP96971.1 MAG: hypothetical protein DMD38_07495 [Gemmatimonadota bacterium]
MLIAVTRAVSPRLAECELTHLPRDPIDVGKAIADHEHYEAALRSLGARVVRAPDEPTLPDGVFVEDAALVLDEIAIITRPGAPSRRPEIESMARALSAYRSLQRIQPPGTLDGGDVLAMGGGREIYVGLSSRTNQEGIAQLETLLSEWGLVGGLLHVVRQQSK